MSTLSVVIPTYNRGTILLDTINLLVSQQQRADEIVVVDQTRYENHSIVATELAKLDAQHTIKWIQLVKPSIPHAMNTGLKEAQSEYVLILDDDVAFKPNFIQNHKAALLNGGPAHVGQIIQPWQQALNSENYAAKNGLIRDLEFPFNSDQAAEIANCMAGNLCLNRQLAIASGGFDEQFEGVAYRFETEFCRRMIDVTGELFKFAPEATLDHLKVPSGGTRDHAQSHLTSLSSSHSVGDYYFALCQLSRPNFGISVIGYINKRFFGSIIAKFYLRQPWWIPVRLLSELMGLVKAVYKVFQGPKHIN